MKNKMIFFVSSVFFFVSVVSAQTKIEINQKPSYSEFGIESVSKEDLKKYAAKPLESDLQKKLSLFLDIQPVRLGQLNPKNSNELFFMWAISGQRQIWKMTGPLSFPVQMTAGKDATSLVDITQDGKFLILQRDSDGQENPGIYIQSTKGGELKKIFHKPKVRAAYQFISDDGNELYYSSNEEKADSFFIYKYNLTTEKIEKVWSKDGAWSVMDHYKNRILLNYQKSSLGNEVVEYNLITKQEKQILGKDKESLYNVLLTNEPCKYLVLTNEGIDFSSLFLFDLTYNQKVSDAGNKKSSENDRLCSSIGTMKPLYSANLKSKDQMSVKSYEIEKIQFHPDRKLIAIEINQDGYTISKLAQLNSTYSKLTLIDLPVFAGADHVELYMLDNRENAVINTVSYNTPRTIHTYNYKTKKITNWNLPQAPEIDLNKFAKAKLEYYESRDQTKIPMFVRRPKSCENKNCPVIVLFHGGPEGQSLPGFSVLGQLFVDNEFIFVEPNVRGSSGYGRKWLDSDNGPKREQVVTDIQDCAQWIRKNWAKNGSVLKVGLFGWSYGGYSTLMGMTYFAGTYDAGVALVGMSDLVSFLNNTASYRRKLRESEYGYLDKDLESLKKLSPINYINKVDAPLLIIQGANDPRVPVGEAVQMQKALEKLSESNPKVISDLIIFPDEGHGASKKENRMLEWGHTLGFFKKHLK